MEQEFNNPIAILLYIWPKEMFQNGYGFRIDVKFEPLSNVSSLDTLIIRILTLL